MSRPLPSIPEAVLNGEAILGRTIEVSTSTDLPSGPFTHTIVPAAPPPRDLTVTQELDDAGTGYVAYSRSITVYGAELRQEWAGDGALAIHAHGEDVEIVERGTLTTVTWPG